MFDEADSTASKLVIICQCLIKLHPWCHLIKRVIKLLYFSQKLLTIFDYQSDKFGVKLHINNFYEFSA